MKLVQHRWVLQADLQQTGILFGGRLLEWIDQDCTMAAHTMLSIGARLTTVGMDRVDFVSPAHLGDRLQFYYEVVHVGNTSITVSVKVSNQYNKIIFKAYTTLVALADDEPTSIQKYILPDFKDNSKLQEQGAMWKFIEQLRQQRKSDPEWTKQ